MKKLSYLFLFMFAVAFTACNDDDDEYSLNNFVVTSATYHSLDGYYYLENDGGETLWPASSYIRPGHFEDGERVVVNYTPLGEDPNGTYDYYVKVNDMESLLTKDMLVYDENTTEVVRDSVGYDPIYINDAWVKDQYLTVMFELPGTFGVHMLNLVYDQTSEENLTDAGFLVLELTQNDYDMALTGYTGWGLVSFDLTQLQSESNDGKTVSFYLKSTWTDGSENTFPDALTYNFETGTLTTKHIEITKEAAQLQELN